MAEVTEFDVAYIKAHFGQDMNAREIAHYRDLRQSDVLLVIATLHRVGTHVTGATQVQPCAVRTPVEKFSIAANVRKASCRDEYEPLSWAEFRELYPEGQA